MTLAPLDFLSGTTCQLCPGVQPWGPGWYLVAETTRVEAGPFATEADAQAAAQWLEDTGMGVHPGPWLARWSSFGLLVGSRIRQRGAKTSPGDLAPTG